MKKEDIRFDDWSRILFGEGPPAYLLEVVVRVAIVYILILIAMRILGKRMIAEVGRADVVARVSLAAAVGLPIQRPGRGLLVALVIVSIIVFIGRMLAWYTSRKKSFEKAFQGIHAILVSDGIIDKERLNKVRLSREDLFAELRSEDIRHLGEVDRVYMEPNGKFSVIKKDDPLPGLSVIPSWDQEMRDRQQQTDLLLCKECGSKWNESVVACIKCSGIEQEYAIILPAKG